MPGKFAWMTDTTGLLCGSFDTDHGDKRYMVVESEPDGGWDWVAWANDGSGSYLHGRSDTPGHAIQAAEHGAEVMSTVNVVDLGDYRAGLLQRQVELTT